MSKLAETAPSASLTRKIYLAAPRGFCAGVDRAIEIVERALQVYGTPLYVNHEIVHNSHVVNQLTERGVVFVNQLSEVPNGSTVIFSAHGVAPQLWKQAEARNLEIIDATCPLVTKVHIEAKRYARENYNMVLIGHKNHVEAIGTYGEAPDKITIIETEEEVEDLSYPENSKLAFITQTTLSIRDTQGIIARLKQKFPQIEGPKSSDICYATSNRQEAVASLAAKVDLILVIGSQNSSNSTRLKELAEKMGTRAFLIDNAEVIDPEWISSDVNNIGITAGASAPEILVEQVIERLKTDFGFKSTEELRVKDEDVVFQLPKVLRDIS